MYTWYIQVCTWFIQLCACILVYVECVLGVCSVCLAYSTVYECIPGKSEFILFLVYVTVYLYVSVYLELASHGGKYEYC